eukprot:1393959-Amorphochlora_amoeboformis.AAC.2
MNHFVLPFSNIYPLSSWRGLLRFPWLHHQKMRLALINAFHIERLTLATSASVCWVGLSSLRSVGTTRCV